MATNFFYALGRKTLFALPPECAHMLFLRALASDLLPELPPLREDPRLRMTLCDLSFAHPVGLAAGLDKNAVAIRGLLGWGLSFIEIGSVTPLPQEGNPKPRLFRLPEDRALINRLGFNNAGHAAVLERIKRFRAEEGGATPILGVNMGANRGSCDRIKDYVEGLKRFSSCASYVTLNISSPNTPHLRQLQEKEALGALLERVFRSRAEILEKAGQVPPIFLKIAPDFEEEALKRVAEEVLRERSGGRIAALIVSNTTCSRTGLMTKGVLAKEEGGLSGAPLFEKSTAVLGRLYGLVGKEIPLIGVGGIDTAEKAWIKITAGATLLQLYTGLIYEGPSLISRILTYFTQQLDHLNFSHLKEAVGCDAEEWAARF